MKGFTLQNEWFYHPRWRVLPPRTHAFYHSYRENFRKKSKSQKVFDFSNFSFFSTFRAEISWNGNFSAFRLFAVENRATSQKSTQLGQSYQEIQGPMEVALPHLYDIIIYPYYTILFVCNPMISQALEKMHHHNIPSLFNHDFTRLSSLQLLVEESMDPEVLRGSFWVISPTQNWDLSFKYDKDSTSKKWMVYNPKLQIPTTENRRGTRATLKNGQENIT
jgi:hypothetical protein